ncbi:O-antigen ligase family protein [Mesonia sp. MT50]|uniref:O-antigen ligase family protein n=1 Tax=Mesonia profundi TaxID=3070998 RepID=A0ABU1A5K8_9FLAO|nr:O-antigen ligase family protein [Mesonia profundi]MDQ7918279.1 O-antigen ligase family protein [Mesonia profundi]
MQKILWLLTVITIPLLMISEFRFASIPLTHISLLILGALNFKSLFKIKVGNMEKSIYYVFLFFIIISLLDLTRSLRPTGDFFYEFKLILLLITIKLYSFFIFKYGINFFLKWLILSSGLILTALIFRSLFIYNASFFVVDAEQVSESGKNQLSFYLALTTPFVVWFFKNFKMNLIWKIIAAASLIIHLFSAIYVQSKGIILATLGSYFITFLFYSSKKLRLGSILKIGIALLIPVYLIVSSEYIDLSGFETELTDLLNQNTASSNSATERLNFINRSWGYFLDNPFIGIGTNNFGAIEEKATHNNYLQIMSENGLLGFIIFIIFLYYIHLYLLKLKSPEPIYFMAVNSFWALTIYLFVINGFFNAITVIILSIVIYFEKSSKCINHSKKDLLILKLKK